MPDQPPKKFQLSWDADLVDLVDATAALAGLSRTEWLGLAAQNVLDRRIKLNRHPPAVALTGCSHPKADRQQLGYGTRCLVCQRFL